MNSGLLAIINLTRYPLEVKGQRLLALGALSAKSNIKRPRQKGTPVPSPWGDALLSQKCRLDQEMGQRPSRHLHARDGVLSLLCLRVGIQSWLVWLSGPSTGLQTTETLLVRFPVRAHAWVAGHVPQLGVCEKQPVVVVGGGR